MKEYKCNIAQNGYFAGPVYCIRSTLVADDKDAYQNKDFKCSEDILSNSEKEMNRLYDACSKVRNGIAHGKSDSANSDIRQTVLFILDDEVFKDCCEKNIRELGLNAEAAVTKAGEELSMSLGEVDSDYIRSRQDDIRGVARALVAALEGADAAPETCSALCAAEISPAQLSSIDEQLIGALISDKGSPNSHAAILAGNLGVPYLYGNSDAVSDAAEAGFVIVDSETGTVVLDPDEEIRAEALNKMQELLKLREVADESEAEAIPACRTKVYANIAGPQDVEALLESGADGVGLFRTEFLFLGSEEVPSEEEQLEAYSRVLDAMGDKEVIIRTMDIGSDKKADWLEIPNESNPALGLRGVRVSLERKELFRTQLRALLRSGIRGNLKLMFPMIADIWEINEIKERIKEVAEELAAEGLEYRIPELGIMVETPAAAVCADILAEEVSFFSIGTNDLTQYTIALDREAQGLERYFNPHHEAVFRLVEMTAEGGRKKCVRTAVCGQLAADPKAIRRLIEAGVAELSVPVNKVKATKLLVAEAEQMIGSEKYIEADNAGSKALYVDISAVADGELIPMEEIPDPVFSAGTLGDCFGILPDNGNIYAPIDGTVVDISKTGHAITVKSDDGHVILVHVGIDTVKLEKKAFTHLVSVSNRVERDQLMMRADLNAIRAAGLSSVIVVVVEK